MEQVPVFAEPSVISLILASMATMKVWVVLPSLALFGLGF